MITIICPHDKFENYACTYCGKECLHPELDEDGRCLICGFSEKDLITESTTEIKTPSETVSETEKVETPESGTVYIYAAIGVAVAVIAVIVVAVVVKKKKRS